MCIRLVSCLGVRDTTDGGVIQGNQGRERRAARVSNSPYCRASKTSEPTTDLHGQILEFVRREVTASMTTLQQPHHPVLSAVATVTSALGRVAEVNPSFMGTDQKTATLLEIARAKAQLAELELRVLAVAEDVAAESAARDVAAWLHHHTHQSPEALRADLRLASALDRSYGLVAAAMRTGECSLPQAHVIVAALDDLPTDLDPETRLQAEKTLVAYAGEFDPTQLRRLGRRILDVIAPQIAEAEEARRLTAEEAHARKKTRLSMRRLGDGTTRISAVIPDAGADRLATNLEAFASPRRDDGTRTDTGEYLPYDRRLGRAFCQLLEALPGCPSTAVTRPRWAAGSRDG
jgi:proteasome lid subunit RPN8/RPN11